MGGTDSSDGLATAVALLARGSGCTALLERASLPIDPTLAPLAQAEAWCLGGGEDFELVLALPPAWCEAFLAALPGSAAIGRLVPGPGQVVWAETGESVNPNLGYRHFEPS